MKIFVNSLSFKQNCQCGFGCYIENNEELSDKMSYGFRLSTSNRMILFGLVDLFNYIASFKLYEDVIIITSNQYIYDMFSKFWIFAWKRKNFDGCKNSDILEDLLDAYNFLCRRSNSVSFVYVDRKNKKEMNYKDETEKSFRFAFDSAKNKAFYVDSSFEKLM